MVCFEFPFFAGCMELNPLPYRKKAFEQKTKRGGCRIAKAEWMIAIVQPLPHTLHPWSQGVTLWAHIPASLIPRCNSLSSHSQVPAGNKHDQDMTSRNRQPNLVGTLPVSTFLFRGWFKPPFRLEACLFIVILAVAWLPNASKIEQTWWWHNRIVFQMQWRSTSHSEWSAAFLFFMNTMCPTHVWLQNG